MENIKRIMITLVDHMDHTFLVFTFYLLIQKFTNQFKNQFAIQFTNQFVHAAAHLFLVGTGKVHGGGMNDGEDAAVASAFAQAFDAATTGSGDRFVDPLWKIKRLLARTPPALRVFASSTAARLRIFDWALFGGFSGNGS